MDICRQGPILLSAFAPLVLAAETTRLEAEAARADASVRPMVAGSKNLQLPSLDFRINVEARCPDGKVAESLSISVADSRITLRRDEIADTNNHTVDLTIPASQVAPLSVENFCLAEDGGSQELLVEDAFSAHLSLRCSSEDGESIVYATRPLPVTLVCDRQAQGESEASTLR